MIRLVLAALLFLVGSVQASRPPVRIGSKSDTETTILGEVIAHLVRDAGEGVDLKNLRLGGTRFVWDALLADSLDVYPEYTGTLSEQIFAGRGIRGEAALRAELARHGIGMTRPLGFANNYALGMRRARANELGIRSISDLKRHPDLIIGFSNEFLKRTDGWPGLQSRYGLPQKNVKGMDHRLAYEALATGSIDLTELYTTDAEIQRFDLVTLEDDLAFFPLYEAVLVYRLDLEQKFPAAVAALRRLEGRVTGDVVIAMNGRAVDGESPVQISADFVSEQFGIRPVVVEESRGRRLLRLTLEHLTLVGVALAGSILVALPLGVLAARRPGLGRMLIGGAGLGMAEEKAKFDAAKLVGKWKITEGTKSGMKVEAKNLEAEVTIDKDTVTIKGADDTHVMSYKIDATKSPVEITMEGKEGPAKGTTADGIVVLEGDTLKLAYATNIPGLEGKRPTKFESTAENKAFLFVLKKAK